jgi:predicted nuclease of predicted toxin-antitoxin system
LADENCDRLLVAALRNAGHDVAYVLEDWRGESDAHLYRIANEQNRAILTDDLDFGVLAEREGEAGPTIILMRLDPLSRDARIHQVTAVINALTEQARGQLVVIEPGQTRTRKYARR